MQPEDFKIKNLGSRKVKSPLELSLVKGDQILNFVDDGDKILFDVSLSKYKEKRPEAEEPLCMERAGPRERIFFEPSKTTAAIVSCGGLCPGINNVIRSLIMGLHYRYGVKKILGVRYGFRGFIPENGHPLIELTPEWASHIHQFGGTRLGSSRGHQDVGEIVDSLEKNDIDILFAIGGDGTLRGASAIADEVEKRGLTVSVVGIPKTIDNDIRFIDRSFGFETAFTVASPIIRDAHNEARGAYNGVAIVKLMGRDSGFIAAHAALSMPEVNIVLIPEMDFDLEGPNGLLAVVDKRLESRKHCLIVVAEGVGQYLFKGVAERRDASGNVLKNDIGTFLRDKITNYFKEKSTEVTVKYIDPSYIIRSAPATPPDSIFCNKLGLHAVHGAMAGKTGFVVAMRNNSFVYLPIGLVTGGRKKVDIEGDLWHSVLETTGQPMVMKNR